MDTRLGVGTGVRLTHCRPSWLLWVPACCALQVGVSVRSRILVTSGIGDSTQVIREAIDGLDHAEFQNVGIGGDNQCEVISRAERCVISGRPRSDRIQDRGTPLQVVGCCQLGVGRVERLVMDVDLDDLDRKHTAIVSMLNGGGGVKRVLFCRLWLVDVGAAAIWGVTFKTPRTRIGHGFAGL